MMKLPMQKLIFLQEKHEESFAALMTQIMVQSVTQVFQCFLQLCIDGFYRDAHGFGYFGIALVILFDAAENFATTGRQFGKQSLVGFKQL